MVDLSLIAAQIRADVAKMDKEFEDKRKEKSNDTGQ